MNILLTASWTRLLTALLLVFAACGVYAERVADLPMPTSYVNDFAGVLSPEAKQQIENLSLDVHNKANAEIAVVTIKQLDDGQSVEEFKVQLEEKWKLGKKGEDRSAIVVLVLNPHKLAVETGYGLEGILNDAKVGAILDTAVPFARTGDYDHATLEAVQGLAKVVADDAHVQLEDSTVVHQYHRVPARRAGSGSGQWIVGGVFVLVLLFLIFTGNAGWAFMLLANVLGSGGGFGGGGGGRDDDNGGGFGGSGGGESGGGGASRDF